MSHSTKLLILFVCHGNICRSPMAEFIFRRLVARHGLSDSIDVASAATSAEEIGNPVYPLAKRTLAMHGIGCPGKTASQITKELYDASHYVVCMEQANVANVMGLLRPSDTSKLVRLLDFLPEGHPAHGHDIDDPWYTRRFDRAYDDITLGCQALLERLMDSEL